MKNNNGFTLVELLIAVAITMVLAVAIMTLYIKNMRVNTDQTTVVRVQQNIRSTAGYLVRQIRMAGYIGDNSGTAGITTATEGQFQFTTYNEDTNNLDDIDFFLDSDTDTDGVIDGGIANNTGTNLEVRFGGAGPDQALAENIHAVGFAYAFSNGGGVQTYTTTGGDEAILWAIPGTTGNWMRLDSNADGRITAADDGDNNGELNLVDTGIAVDNGAIRTVRFSILGTSHRQAQDYTNNETYIVGRHVLVPNDTIRRRLLTTAVACRNMGL